MSDLLQSVALVESGYWPATRRVFLLRNCMRHVLSLQLLLGAAQGKLRLEEGPQVLRLLQLNLLLPSLG